MKNNEHIPASQLFLIAFLSSALLCFQIYLINLLSITQWYHFAYMVISIALLGFGSAGTFLSILKHKMKEKYDIISSSLTLITALLISLSVSLSQTDIFYFDSYKIFTGSSQLVKLFGFYLLFTSPFFCGALVIGLSFVRFTNDIGILYFSNMAGSGLGAVLFLLFASHLNVENIPSVISILTILAIIISLKNYTKKKSLILILLIILSISTLFFISPTLIFSEYKGFSKILSLPDSEIFVKENSVHGEISLIKSPSLRYAPGLSLVFKNKVPTSNSAFVNGNWKGPLIDSDAQHKQIFTSSTVHLPYIISEREKVLCLESGSGKTVKEAIFQNSKEIIAVEQNKTLTELLRNDYSGLVDSVYNNINVRLYNVTSRNFILNYNKKFDLIHLPTIDAFGGTSGIDALKTDYLFTQEAFDNMLSILTNKGVICVSTYIDYPYNNALKLFSIISEVLNKRGIIDPSKHLAAIKNWNTITIIVRKEIFEDSEIQLVKNFCNKLNFDPVVLSGIKSRDRNYYNKLSDTLFFSYIDDILISPSSRERFYEDYPFNISSPTDDKPYFSQFMKLSSITRISDTFGKGIIPFFEIGYILLYMTFLQTVVISFILILIPLIIWKLYKFSKYDSLKINIGNKIGTFLYFSGIGFGYIFLEIVFVQYFNLYLGNIIYSTSMVISLMLISSGLGSYFSDRITINRNNITPVFVTILILLILLYFFLLTIIKSTVTYSLFIKILISILIIFPPSFLMGIPFPHGIKYLGVANEDLIPWGWGINGVFSVIGVVLATIISVEIGQSWLILLTAFAYSLPMFTKFAVKKNAPLLS